MINLCEESLDLLLSCLKNNPAVNTDELIEKVLDPMFENYTPTFYNTLRLIVTDEFCGKGLKEDSEPNEYGLKLEELIDEIGRLFM